MIERIIDGCTLKLLSMKDDKIYDHIQNSLSQCSYFFEQLYSANPPGWLLLSSKKEAFPYPISIMSNDKIVSDIIQASSTKDVCFSIGLRRNKPTQETLNDPQEIVALPGFWIVIPIQSKLHRRKDIPSSVGEALKFIKSKCMKPDIIIDTGYELQVHWNFEQLEIFDSAGSIYKIKQMSRDFQREIIKAGKTQGWQLNDNSHFNAVLRVPGTFNWKLYPPKPVTMLEPKENVWKFY